MKLTTKLLRMYKQATPENNFYGLVWYFKANKVAQNLAEQYNVSLEVACGVLAALSPNNKWEQNIRDANNFLARPSIDTKVCTFKSQREKALKILNAKSELEIMTILNGRKTCNFFRNMLHPKSSVEVTVDLWMFRLAETKATKKAYDEIEESIKFVSRKLGILPHQLQAVLWTVIRG